MVFFRLSVGMGTPGRPPCLPEGVTIGQFHEVHSHPFGYWDTPRSRLAVHAQPAPFQVRRAHAGHFSDAYAGIEQHQNQQTVAIGLGGRNYGIDLGIGKDPRHFRPGRDVRPGLCRVASSGPAEEATDGGHLLFSAVGALTPIVERQAHGVGAAGQAWSASRQGHQLMPVVPDRLGASPGPFQFLEVGRNGVGRACSGCPHGYTSLASAAARPAL